MNYKPAKLYDADGNLSARWFVFYSFKDPSTGKYQRFIHYISKKNHTRQQRYERARILIKDINRKLHQGFNPFIFENKSVTPICETFDHYLKIKKRQNRKRTYTSYSSYINGFKEWLEKNRYDKIAVDSFNYNHAKEYMDHINKRDISNRTYNNTLQAIKTYFNYLISEEYILINPFFKQKKLKLEETEIISFTPEEIKKVSENLPGYDYNLYVIALLIFNCFMRPQEIVRLRVRNIKDAGDFLQIGGEVSKNRKNEVVQLTPALKTAIKKLDLNYPSEYFVFGYKMKRNKREIAPTRIAEAWRAFAGEYGIEKNLYSLKHTGNGLALENGANTRDLQLQNRHSSLEQTQKYLDRFSKTPSDRFIKTIPSL